MRAYNRNESELILNQSGLMEALFPVSGSTRKASWLLHGFCGRHGPTSGIFESLLLIPFADAHLNSILGGGMQDIHILSCDERNLVVTPFIGAPIWFRVLDTPLTIPFSLPTTPLRLRHAPIVLRLHPTALLEDVQSAQKKHTAQLQRDLTFQLGRSPKSCFRFKHRSIRLVSQN